MILKNIIIFGMGYIALAWFFGMNVYDWHFAAYTMCIIGWSNFAREVSN
jgi:hypothetical protein